MHKFLIFSYNIVSDIYLLYPQKLKKSIFFRKRVLTNYILCVILFKQLRVDHKRGDVNSAGVAKLADARDLKSRGARAPYGFDSRSRHHLLRNIAG